MLANLKAGYTNNHIEMITNNREQVKHKKTVRLKTDSEKANTIAKLKKINMKIENGAIVTNRGKVVAPNHSFIVIDIKGNIGEALYLSNNNLYIYTFEIVGKKVEVSTNTTSPK